MDYFLTEEQEMIVDIARQITDEKIIPKRAELDEKDEFPREILEAMGQADLFGNSCICIAHLPVILKFYNLTILVLIC